MQRKGRKNRPFYRVVVAEHSAPVKGKFIEILGHYDPITKDTVLKKDAILKYVSNGAQPSDTFARLAVKNGITELEKFVEKRFQHPKKEAKAESAE